MSPESDSFDLSGLSNRAGVTPRTVRYYIQQGLLAPPGARGPGAHYEQGHLDRLELIRRLQREHLPLAEIRRRLDALDDRAVRELLRAEQPKRKLDALDYVRDVLARRAGHEPVVRESFPARGLVTEPRKQSRAGERSQWEHITLAPDIELHVRRPLSREQNKKVERLIETARTLFEEDAS